MADLARLRGIIKRDPDGHRSEFARFFAQFQSTLQILTTFSSDKKAAASSTNGDAVKEAAIPSAAAAAADGKTPQLKAQAMNSKNLGNSKEFADLIDFLSHVSPCYPRESAAYPKQLLDLLENHVENLSPQLRRAVVKALILLRNRQCVPPAVLLPVFFGLFRVADKSLRKLVFAHIVGDLTRINRNQANSRLNKSMQNLMFKILQSENSIIVRKSLGVIIELYRKRVWHDARTVSVVASACFSPHSAVIRLALRFFLGQVNANSGGEEDEDMDAPRTAAEKAAARRKAISREIFQINAGMRAAKRKGKRKRIIQRGRNEMKKLQREQERIEDGRGPIQDVGDNDVSAIRSLHDPQSFAERLFSALRRSKESFETRILMMNVISRLIGSHELLLFNFYAFLQRYMQAHQANVPKILTYLVQACHPLVPPEVLSPCLKSLVDNFVTDRSSPEVITVGLNTIREMCSRQPLVMDATLLQDLALYKKSRDKGVINAARGLIAVFREKAPELLNRRDRGRPDQKPRDDDGDADGEAGEGDDEATEAEEKAYGAASAPVSDVAGASLLFDGSGQMSARALERAVRRKRNRGAADDDDDEGWDAAQRDTSLKKSKKQRRLARGSDSDDEDSSENDSDFGDEVLIGMSDFEEDEDDEESENEGDDEDQKKSEEQQEETKQEDDSSEQEMDDEDGDADKSSSTESKPDIASESELPEPQFADELPIDIPDMSDDEDEDDADASSSSKALPSQSASTSGASTKQSTSSSTSSKALPVSATRIFTPRDFARIDALRREDAIQKAKDNLRARGGGPQIVKLVSKAEAKADDLTIDEDDLLGHVAVRKREIEDRKADRANQLKTKAQRRMKKGGGTTNEDKLRSKNFKMAKHSKLAATKKKRSLKKQVAVQKKHKKRMQLGHRRKYQRKR